MGGIVGILLVVIAAASVIGVMWIVMKEKHEHEEHYIPPARTETRRVSGATSESDKAEPVTDRAEEQRAQE